MAIFALVQRQSAEVGMVLSYDVTWDKLSILQYVGSTEHHGTYACIFGVASLRI